MKLYFLRHGIAEDEAASDHDRRLTAKGRRRVETAAQVMEQLDLRPATIFSSPRVRARQTAEIVAETLRRTMEVRDEVDFGFNTAAVQVLTAGMKDDVEVMFVGHEPYFSTTARELTGGDIVLKKGGLLRLDTVGRNPLRAELVWAIPPRIFNALTRTDQPDEGDDDE
ncbi:MAG: phosphohistidine phosphatase SixA [bacterium]|nr:phosphohistidine phosphatase SixA [bacterium]